MMDFPKIFEIEVSAVWFCAVETPTARPLQGGNSAKFMLTFPGDALPEKVLEELPEVAERIGRNRHGLCGASSHSRPLIDIREGRRFDVSTVRRHMNEHWCSLDTMLPGSPAKLALRAIPSSGQRHFRGNRGFIHLTGISVSADDLFYPTWDQIENPRIAELNKKEW